MRLPRMEIASELRKELAIGLYQRGALTAGKACELARMRRWDFEGLLAERKVVRPFSVEELEHDLRVAEEMAVQWQQSSSGEERG